MIDCKNRTPNKLVNSILKLVYCNSTDSIALIATNVSSWLHFNVPKTPQEVITSVNSSNWQEAMHDEMNTLKALSFLTRM